MYICASVKNLFDEPKSFRRGWASSRETRPELLAQLADDPFPAVRELVAGNRNTPLSVLEKLLDDPYPEVRDKAAGSIFYRSGTLVKTETGGNYKYSGAVEFYFVIADGEPDTDIPRIPEIITEYINSEGYNVDSIDAEGDSEFASDYMIYVWVSPLYDDAAINELNNNLADLLEDSLDGWVDHYFCTRLLKPRADKG